MRGRPPADSLFARWSLGAAGRLNISLYRVFLLTSEQCFGSGSGLDPDSIRSVNTFPDPGGQKLPTKEEKNFMLDVLFLRAEVFFCNLDILCGGLGKGKL